MKNILISCICFLAACSSPQKLLQQTWKVDDVVFLDSLNTLSPKQVDMLLNKVKADVVFTFLPDSAFQVKHGNDVSNGKWWFGAGKRSLFTSTQENTVESKIYELKKKYFKSGVR